MKMPWPTRRIGEVAAFRPSKSEARTRIDADAMVSFLPMEDLGIAVKYPRPRQARRYSDVAGSYTYFADDDVLLAKITPCFENGKLGIANGLTNGIGFGSSEFIVIRPGSTVCSEWLFYFMSRVAFRIEGAQRMGGAVGQQRIPKDFVASYTIPVPPLREQKRIVTILDGAFAGLAKAKANTEANLQSAQSLNQRAFSVVLDSFAQDRWRICSVEQVAQAKKGSIRTGPFGSQLLHSEFVEQGVPVLGIDNVVLNRFAWGERRYITPQKFATLSRYQVRPGDVLITIMGTCGRCAIVPKDIPTAINSKHLCCISLDQHLCLPEYLHAYFLWHPVAREYLAKKAKGSIMAGLNMGIIKELPLVLPPVDQQRAVVDRMVRVRESVESLERAYRHKVSTLDVLRSSLLHEAFIGNL